MLALVKEEDSDENAETDRVRVKKAYIIESEISSFMLLWKILCAMKWKGRFELWPFLFVLSQQSWSFSSHEDESFSSNWMVGGCCCHSLPPHWRTPSKLELQFIIFEYRKDLVVFVYPTSVYAPIYSTYSIVAIFPSCANVPTVLVPYVVEFRQVFRQSSRAFTTTELL